VRNLLASYHETDIAFFNGDYHDDQEILSTNSLSKLKLYVADKKIIFVDEAQKIPHI
jgi:pyrimidine operon attenuation protein/uracil phosphoribosyltransferase